MRMMRPGLRLLLRRPVALAEAVPGAVPAAAPAEVLVAVSEAVLSHPHLGV